MTLKNIIAMVIVMFIGFVFREIYDNIIKPAWLKNSKDPNKKRALRRLLKYFSILLLISAIVIFMTLNKFFVLLLCVSFSMLVVIFIYDYTLNLLMGLDDHLDKELSRQKRFDLIDQIASINEDSDQKQKLIQELKNLQE